LQIFDDGRLTDSQGRVVNFKNTVIIMTSNLGTEQIQRDDSKEELRRKIMSAFRNHLRPEFLNRIDETVIFNHLSAKDMSRIVDIQFAQIRPRLNQQGLDLALTAKARDFLAAQGYEPDFGARPLKRLIQKRVVDPLSLRLLNGDFRQGNRIEVALNGKDILFKRLKD
ncbi:AAA family ATPase, partial [Candidatus Omnitrophota bacterium]